MGEYTWTYTESEVDKIKDQLYALDILITPLSHVDKYIEVMILHHGGERYEFYRESAAQAYKRRQEEESREYSLPVL